MKTWLEKYGVRSVLFGAVMMLVGYFTGKIRYPYDSASALPPVWVQLIRLFVIYTVAFFVVNCLCGFIAKKMK